LLDRSPESTLAELRTRTAGASAEAPIRTAPLAKPSIHRDASGDSDWGAVSPRDKHVMQDGAGVGAHMRPVVSPGDMRSTRDDAGATTALSAEPVDAFKLALLGFARTTHCADCLRWQESLPFKFYVEVPSAPLDLEPASPRRHAGWWLLAFLSGQFDPDLALLLPKDSPWRRALSTEGNWDDDRMSMLIQTELGDPLSPDALVAWLTRTPDTMGESAWHCLQLARSAWIARSYAAPSVSPGTANTP
jgi:hypothetical protein